jgi:small GTP-binding protein
VFGDSGVGKTSLILRYLTDQFNKDIGKTMGVDIRVKKLKKNDDMITLQIWDFVGEDKFRILFPTYARGSFGGIFMYDLTRKNTLNHIEDWVNIFKKNNIQVPIIMVGGKLDLQETRGVSIEEATSISNSYEIDEYIECSSKTGENIELLFNTLVQMILKNIKLD